MQWIALGLLAAVAAAGVAVLGRVGLRSVDTVLATALRSVTMTVLLVVVAGTRGNLTELVAGHSRLDPRAWGFIVGSGVCGVISWLAYFGALKGGNAAGVAALDRMSLPFVFLLGALALGEQPGWRGWLGLAVVTAGTVLIVWDQAMHTTA